MKVQRIIASSALFSLGASLFAQVSVQCCVPDETFTSDEPCSGSSTTICEEPPIFSQDGFKLGSLRAAVCRDYSPGVGSFVQDDCDFEPDPDWVFIGNMGNGVCCYISTNLFPAPVVTPQGHQIRDCEGDCEGGIH